MSLGRAGKYRKGTEPDDLRTALAEYAVEGEYTLDEYRAARCSCGGEVFGLDYDEDATAARRICMRCGADHLIGDSADFWPDAKATAAECVCGGRTFNVGVGFSLTRDKIDVEWLCVGARCVKCNILGCYVDWEIDYSPSVQLLDQA